MWRIIRFAILLGTLFWVVKHYGVDMPPSSAPQQEDSDQYYYVTRSEADYVTQYFQSFNFDAIPYGESARNVKLPDGDTIEFLFTKTKTGWCPVRHEPLYDLNYQSRKPIQVR